MHDLFRSVDYISQLIIATDSSSSSDQTVKVAIVTAVGLVLAAGITAFASTFQRERSKRSTVPSEDNFARDYIQDLTNDRNYFQTHYRQLQIAHNHLREACAQRGMDPDQLIKEQADDE